MPAGVLRSGALAINPAFPASKVNALQSLALDSVVSLAMLFPGGSGALKDPKQPWLFQDDTNKPTIRQTDRQTDANNWLKEESRKEFTESDKDRN
ncbi:MAG: hypothetical protein NWQ45_01750 [Congregibacter sp.]|nr:hypothetical protein [Congregibacter sp.]